MPTIPFTDREMKRAWRENFQASQVASRSNANRLLLFYSVECGLKAILMQRRAVTSTDLCNEIGIAQHNINKLLDYLSAGRQLKLPSPCMLPPIRVKGDKRLRELTSGQVNQMWRYGGRVSHILDERRNEIQLTDEFVEKKLMEIAEWIKGELNK
ncbi:hypothetical protein IQ260_20905 [Leptolyngbya cf. ectocarpi LEGE 11479]|uniref:HEPN domain-containing protein n=1 Tax=Leptolyngbya cf. ectocarpi LEGE 11479 TaxID=1828722 RepID=A0A929F857_LEPEC|nr:hypothetical protein [Leptolyngbya ectocarpi]MBE9069110.1 hypothetical protein [Leptolyngbya cf. ectocarpi LEGE 11479]